MTNKQESQEKCCDEGVCLNHLKDHQLFCNGRCHSINCPFQAVQESHEGVEEQIAERILPILRTLASQEYQRGALYNHEGTFTRGFEAGRLQGIADAVAVVPEEHYAILGHEVGRAYTPEDKSWNNCRQAMLTALSSLTHKE